MTTAQLLALGIGESTYRGWAGTGYLYPVLPRVYAVGHPGSSEAADLFAAILYAGPGAALSGLSAAVWRDLVKWVTPPAIEVSTPRRRRSLPVDDERNRLGQPIVVRDRRDLRRVIYHEIPTTTPSQTVIDLAAGGDLDLVRIALARMDYMRILNEPALQRMCGQGTPGSAVLREALGRPQPLFARARSKFEIRLVQVCEQTRIPLPEINEKIAGITVDAVWRDEMIVVECDGEGNHGTWRQRRRDTANDMILRALGFLVIRYTYDRLDRPYEIHADLMAQLAERRGRAALYRAVLDRP